MRLCVLAFITLATATAATVTTKSTTLSKEEFVRLITSKLKKRAQNQNSDKCVKEVCADEGDSCNSSIICRGFMECIRGECGYSSFGDPCNNDNKCYGSSLFCHDDRCREFGYEGGYCVDDYDCRTKGRDLYCSATKEREIGTCKKKPKKIGDECFYRKYPSDDYCPTGTYCSATEESGTGVCRPLPSKIGDSCNLERMLCTPNDELYCDNSTKKCRNLPKLNEECYYDDSKSYYVKCFKGYYCDDSMLCKEKKGLNEECKYNGDNCKEGFYCAHTNQGYMCKKLNPTKGEYCDDTYLKCQGMLACQNNICVNKGYECKSQYDCKNLISERKYENTLNYLLLFVL